MTPKKFVQPDGPASRVQLGLQLGRLEAVIPHWTFKEAHEGISSMQRVLGQDTIDREALAKSIRALRGDKRWAVEAKNDPETLYWRDRYISGIERICNMAHSPESHAAWSMDPDEWLKFHFNATAESDDGSSAPTIA